MKSQYSGRIIYDFIVKWLGADSSIRLNGAAADPKDDNCVCIDCLNKINEYDLLCVQAERIETELRNTLLRTESLSEPKTEPIDECTEFENSEQLVDNAVTVETNSENKNSPHNFDVSDSFAYGDESDDENENPPNTQSKLHFKCSECNIILDRFMHSFHKI